MIADVSLLKTKTAVTFEKQSGPWVIFIHPIVDGYSITAVAREEKSSHLLHKSVLETFRFKRRLKCNVNKLFIFTA